MRNWLCAFCLLWVMGSISAQERHHFQFNVGVGADGINYALADGEVKPGVGNRYDALYTYYFCHWVGFTTGINFSIYTSRASVLSWHEDVSTFDDDSPSAAYIYRTKVENLREQQTVFTLGIPIQFRFLIPFTETVGMQAALGGRVAHAVGSNYTAKYDRFSTAGFYPETGVLIEDVPVHGFYTLNEPGSFRGKTALNFLFSLTADLGFYFEFMRGCDLYIGAYYDYPLNGLLKYSSQKHTGPLVEPYNGADRSPSDQYQGILQSGRSSDLLLQGIGGKIGIRVRF